MAQTTQDLVDAVRTRIGFDATETEVLAELNARYKSMCVRAEVFIADVSLGSTVVDQSDYTLATTVAAVKSITVDGVPWRDTGLRQVDGLVSGGQWELWSWSGEGVYAYEQDQDGHRLRLYPTPDEAGLAIVARVVQRPADLTLTDTPNIPEEFFRSLREGVAATFFAEDSEQLAVADRNEARFDAACLELKQMTLRARRSSGPAQMGLRGVNR